MSAPHPSPSSQNHYSSSTQSEINTKNPDTLRHLIGIYLKGIAMGAADIVPGVSGGTIALIAGIYQRLINALGSIDLSLWHIYQQQGGIKGILAVWRAVDATFLLALLMGIATSFVTLAGAIKYLLDNEPLYIWSFFFGLVVMTIFVLLTKIKRWNMARIGLFVIGIAIAVSISSMPLITTSPSLLYIFFAGAIAICAMILPGISGSFILLLLGVYHTILEAVHNADFSIIITLMAGMATGLLLFTHVLKWLLARYYQGTLALLTGFIAGSLMKVWPWKVNQFGEAGSLGSVANYNVMPWQYPIGAQWGITLGLMALGIVVVLLLSWWGQKQSQR